jgi:hypothetical protein
MKEEKYRGRTIDARSTPLQGGGCNAWGMIYTHRGDHTDVEEFQAPGVFPSEDEGVEAALAYGRKLIDSKIDG